MAIWVPFIFQVVPGKRETSGGAAGRPYDLGDLTLAPNEFGDRIASNEQLTADPEEEIVVKF